MPKLDLTTARRLKVAGGELAKLKGDGFDWFGLFDPSQLDDLSIWLDGSDASTLTTSRSDVTHWAGKNGVANTDFSQTTASLRPTTGSTTINGMATVRFANEADVMVSDTNPFGSSIANAFVIVVHKITSSGNGTLFALTDNSTTNSTIRWQSHVPWSDGNLYFDVGGTSGSNRVSASYGVSVDTPVMTSFYGSVADSKQEVYNNGTFLVGDSNATSVPTSGNVRLGRQRSSVGEFIVINGQVDTANRQRLEGYLAHKWGMLADLPSEHPYKTQAPRRT